MSEPSARRPAHLPPLARVSAAAAREQPGTADRTLVFVCHGPSCSERGSEQLFARLASLAAAEPGRSPVRLCRTTCLDNCATGPNVVLGVEGAIQTGMVPSTAEALWRMASGRRDDGDGPAEGDGPDVAVGSR